MIIYNEIYERVLVQMDKYEFNIKVEQIKKLMKKKDYITAVKIADTIDWEKVKQKQLLIMAADVYEIAGKYDDARDVLLLAYERTGLGRQLAYRLCRLSVKRGDFAEAEEFYEEFVHNSPLDAGKYILSYEISKGRGESVEKQILMLEAYIEEDMDDRWAYELAKLYHRARFRDKCVEMCDTIILWFAEGKYVEKAMELKQVYEPLSESQRIKYEAQKSRKAEEVEPVKNEEETEQQLPFFAMVEKEPKSRRELKLKSELKYELKSEPKSEIKSQPEPETVVVEKKNGDILDEVNEADIDVNSIHVRDYSVNNKYDTVNLQKELARSVSSLFDNTIDIFKPNVKKETGENEDKFVDDQIEGQMHLEEVLAMFESGELRVKDDSKETKEQVAEVTEDVIEDVVIEEKVETIEELEIVAGPIVEVEEVIEEQQKSIADVEEVVNEIEVVEENTIEVEEKTTEIEAEKQKEEEEKALEVAEKEAIIAMLSENNTKKKSRNKRRISKDKRVADIIAGEIAAMQAFEDDLSADDDFYEKDDYEDDILDEEVLHEEISKSLKVDAEKAKLAEDSSDKDVNKLARERNVQMFDLKQENEDEKVEDPKLEEKVENPKLEEKTTKTPSESAKEELKNFIGRFAGVQGLDKQILKVMQNTLKVDKSPVKFIFVKGEVKSGKTTLAIEVLKLANKLMQRRDQRIAKIKAENINGKSVSGLLTKLDGSDVLIERVSDMDVDTFVEFIDKVKEENKERIVIFEDEKSLADAFLEKVPQSYATFANILDIRQNKIKDWARMAENYAKSKGYAFDEMGTLALSAKIDQLRAITLVVHKDHIEQLVDGAIKNRNRLSLSRLFGRSGGKNEDGLKLLTERDFSL